MGCLSIKGSVDWKIFTWHDIQHQFFLETLHVLSFQLGLFQGVLVPQELFQQQFRRLKLNGVFGKQ